MSQIKLNFSDNTIRHIHVYKDSPKTESRTEGAQVKLTETQKKAIQEISMEQGIGVSTLIGEALETYIEMLPALPIHKRLIEDQEKIVRHEELLFKMLGSLS